LQASSAKPRIALAKFGRRAAMPQYEFFCKDCQKRFSLILSFTEYDRGDFECPECHGRNVEQKLSAFFAVTSKKS
jgi:putative FmdB family regulatory protein